MCQPKTGVPPTESETTSISLGLFPCMLGGCSFLFQVPNWVQRWEEVCLNCSGHYNQNQESLKEKWPAMGVAAGLLFVPHMRLESLVCSV